MTPPKSASKAPSLSDLIEIIREPQQPASQEISFPPDDDDSNPLHALQSLTEKIELLTIPETNSGSSTDQESQQSQDRYLSGVSDIEKYIELFQKQSVALKKIMSRLN